MHAGPLHSLGRDGIAPGRTQGGRVGQAFTAQPYQASLARCQALRNADKQLFRTIVGLLCCLLPLPYKLLHVFLCLALRYLFSEMASELACSI